MTESLPPPPRLRVDRRPLTRAPHLRPGRGVRRLGPLRPRPRTVTLRRPLDRVPGVPLRRPGRRLGRVVPRAARRRRRLEHHGSATRRARAPGLAVAPQPRCRRDRASRVGEPSSRRLRRSRSTSVSSGTGSRSVARKARGPASRARCRVACSWSGAAARHERRRRRDRGRRRVRRRSGRARSSSTRSPTASGVDPVGLNGWSLLAVLSNQVSSTADVLLLGHPQHRERRRHLRRRLPAPERVDRAARHGARRVPPARDPRAARGPERYRSLLHRSLRCSRAAAARASLLLATPAYFLVPVLFGSAYDDGQLPAADPDALDRRRHPRRAVARVRAGARRRPALRHDPHTGAAVNIVGNLVLIPLVRACRRGLRDARDPDRRRRSCCG